MTKFMNNNSDSCSLFLFRAPTIQRNRERAAVQHSPDARAELFCVDATAPSKSQQKKVRETTSK